MIQALQKFSQSRVAKIFLAIVALSFVVFFGGGSWFQRHDPNAFVAEIGGVSIGRHEFADKVQKQAQVMMTEGSMNREDLFKAGFPQVVLSQLVQEILLDLEATHLGLTINDETVRHHIHSIKGFQDEKGVFNHTLFAQILRANGLSEDVFIARVRQELIREQLINAITIGTLVPNDLKERLFDAEFQHRQASLFIVSPKDMPLPVFPSPATLEAFYNDHQKEFETPEFRSFAVLVVDPTVLAKDIPVNEEEIKAAYEAKTEAKKPLEAVRASVVADIQKEKAIEKAHEIIKEVDDKIAGGSTFEELAPLTKGASLIKLEMVDAQGRDRMETPSPHLPQDKELTQAILKTAFSLEENMDSPFAQTPNGIYYAARVDKISPAAFQPFSEIKDRVAKIWVQEEQFKAAKIKAEDYVKAFNQGERKISTMTLLPILSLSEPSPSVSDEVKSLVFSLRPNRAGLAFTPAGFAVVVLNKIIPPDAKTKEEKMPLFEKALLRQYQNDLLSSYLNALRVRYPVKINKKAIDALYNTPSQE